MAFRISEPILCVNVDAGLFVRKGLVLAEIDPRYNFPLPKRNITVLRAKRNGLWNYMKKAPLRPTITIKPDTDFNKYQLNTKRLFSALGQIIVIVYNAFAQCVVVFLCYYIFTF